MPGKMSPELVRRLKALGFVDLGTHYIPNGFNRIPKERPWDIEEDQMQ